MSHSASLGVNALGPRDLTLAAAPSLDDCSAWGRKGL